MFREGRIVIPGGGWFEWTVEDGKKQPWYISRKDEQPILMAGLTYFRPHAQQQVEVGFVIVTEDSERGMVHIHDRRPVVLERKTLCAGWIRKRRLRKQRILLRADRWLQKSSGGGR